jgi:hypothetical protein
MKAKKLAELLLKHPDHEVRVTNRDNGNMYAVTNKVDVRTGVVFIETGEELSSDTDNDEGTMWPFNAKEALKEAKDLLADLNGIELTEFLADHKVKTKEEFLKKMQSDEKALQELAKNYFHMK